MSDPSEVMSGTKEADTEVELSAQDLLALSAPRAAEHRTSVPTPIVSKSLTEVSVISAAPSAPPSHTHVPTPKTEPRTALPRVVLALGLTVAAVGTAGALYTYRPSTEVKQSSPPRVQPAVLPEWTAPEPEPEPVGKPVRFTNPFDKTEVFEFPHGTTRTEARDKVRELLLARAMERQGQHRGPKEPIK
jgi:hypothetical protein